MNWKRWSWPVILLISTAAALLTSLLGFLPPLRLLATLWFMILCPGMALQRVVGLRLPVSGWTLAIAFSLALDSAVGIALLYSGKWSWQTGIIILAALTVVCVVIDLLPRQPEGLEPAIVVTKVPARPRKRQSVTKTE